MQVNVRTVSFVLAVVCCATLVSAQGKPAAGQEVVFDATDGVRVFGDFCAAPEGPRAPLVLLFHQANSNSRGEYTWIAGRLVEKGYNVLAIDQRSGGDRFHSQNRTRTGLEGKQYGFCDAYPDLLAAMDYADTRGLKGKRFAWGSSYSAALVIQLAAEHGKRLAGVLAFSPASGNLGDCATFRYAPRVDIPVAVFRPESEMARGSVKAQFTSFEDLAFKTYVMPGGVHGSSMLHPERASGDVEPTWQKVFAFLEHPAAAE